MAQTEPAAITRHGRERIVVLSVDEYQRLKRRDRQVPGLDDFTQADLEAIKAAEPPPEAARFDSEMTGWVMPLPQPVPGLGLRYAYPWQAEPLRGQEEGVKDQPGIDDNQLTLVHATPTRHPRE